MLRIEEIQRQLRALDAERRASNARFLLRARKLSDEALLLAEEANALAAEPPANEAEEPAPPTIGIRARPPLVEAPEAPPGTLTSAKPLTNQPSETAASEGLGSE